MSDPLASKSSSSSADEHELQILRSRARALSRRVQTGDESTDWLEVLEFQLAHERYAVEAQRVVEIQPLVDLAPLPCTPAFISGIVNVRGRITPVIDIKKFFDLPDPGLTDLHRIIVVRAHGLEVGLLADVVVAMHKVRADLLQTGLVTLTGIRSEYLRGVSPERIAVLDVERMLDDPKLCVEEHVKD